MMTLFCSDRVHRLSEMREAAAAQISRLPQMVAAIGEVDTVLRFEFHCEPMRPLGWLHNQVNAEKVYWSDRDGREETAGVGRARLVTGSGALDYHAVFDAIDRCLGDDNQRIRFYGGFSFDPGQADGEWRDFKTHRWVVPRFEVVRRDQDHVFAVNVRIAEIEPDIIALIISEMNALEFSGETRYREVPRRLSRVDYPNRGGWERILAGLSLNHDDKVVLARRSDFAFHVPIRPSALVNFLKVTSPGCYHFCFQPRHHHGFVGASPERLLRIEGGRLWTEAVAGTMPAGASAEEANNFRGELLASDKCRREQAFVIEHLRRHLRELCVDCDIPEEPEVMSLKNVQHLYSRMTGRLAAGVHRAEVLAALHPTPAVCGYPTAEARDRIRVLEEFSRGWYAGPVGWIARDSCEFAVAIRSGLVTNYILSLFAGAGIVEGSRADEEWEEIETKISRFMRVFG